MRTTMSVSATILILGSLYLSSSPTPYRTIEQSFYPAENQEMIVNKSHKKAKGNQTPYRGSGRREFM